MPQRGIPHLGGLPTHVKPNNLASMNCPACDSTLTELRAGQILVDACHAGCGGVWFDNFELQKVDERHEPAGASLNVLASADVRIKAAPTRACPRCEGQPLRRHFFSFKKHVQVDCCPACGGYWLDAGELAVIRAEFPTEADRRLATEQFVSDVAKWELAGAVREQGKPHGERARSVAGLLRLVGG